MAIEHPHGTGPSGWIRLPPADEDFTANPVELFFDLAFVFAFAQLVSFLVHHHDLEGILEAGLLFWMLWLPWTQLTWSANAVSAHARNVQALMLVATVASVPMAAAVTSALDDAGWMFTIPISVILLMGLVLMTMGHPTGSAEWRSAIVYGIPNAAAIGLFLLGSAFDDQPVRVTLWLAGIAIIAGGTFVAGKGDWIIRPGHFAERHGLIIIIALGEVIVAIAVPVLDALDVDEGLPKETIASLAFAGLFAALLWWGYFDRPQKVFESRFEQVTGSARAQYARDVYTYIHALIVSGVIFSAAALEEITLHPDDTLDYGVRMMLLLGLGLFFGGVELATLRAYHVVPPERAGAIAVLAAVLFLGENVDGIWLLAAIDLVIFITLVLEGRRLEHPGDTRRAVTD
ncbi:MAG: low temperature requirement protein A [Acidimicrobiales bacterium]|nr:low temperature requirement protein A [Acidimicrobiales bacterium]